MDKKGKKKKTDRSIRHGHNTSKKWTNNQYIKYAKWALGIFVAIFTAVIAWFLTAPNVFPLGLIYPPKNIFAQSLAPGEFTARGTMEVRLRNISLRPASVRAEIIPKGAVIFDVKEKKKIDRIERIPDFFELSRSTLDTFPNVIPPFSTKKVGAEYLLGLKLIGRRVVYVYKLRWIVDNQGEVASACLRFPTWAPGVPPVSDKDSKILTCD